MTHTQRTSRTAETVYTFEDAAQYHYVSVDRIKAIARASHFGVIGYVLRGESR